MSELVKVVTIGDYRYDLWDDGHAEAKVTDTSKTSYGALQASVTHEGVTYRLTSLDGCFYPCRNLTTAPAIPSGVTGMRACFENCTALMTAPSIPSSVTDMNSCFYGCTSLTTAPSIPSSVTDMSGCFRYCTSLTTAPSIPSGATSVRYCFEGCTALTALPSIPSNVTDVRGCFQGCTSITGTTIVHGTPTYYDRCFANTTQPIVLVVTDTSETSRWTRIAATGNNGNVTVRDVSANPAPTATITAVRVLSQGSTTPDETGQYAYVTVRTTASTEQAPDNVALAPTITLDGTTYTPADPSGTATFTCWVSLGNDLGHVIGATPRDTYKTGTPVTVTLASTYSPMEFHATPVYDEHGTLMGYIGGDGAAFGQHATRAGWLDVAWNMDVGGDADVHGDVSADGALSCADGSPYCKDGTDVKVGGVTVGSADNLSYVASTDTLRAPIVENATRTSATSGGFVMYYVIGRLVVGSFTLNITTIARNTVVATGLPLGLTAYGESAFTVGAASNSRTVPMYVNLTNGNFTLATTAPSADWYNGTFAYVSAS